MKALNFAKNKRYLAFLLLFGLAQLAQAQYYDRAIGLRTGTTVGLSYKYFTAHQPSVQQAVEGLLSLQLDEWRGLRNGLLLEGLYFVHWDWGFDTGFSVFTGAGLFAGAYNETGRPSYFGGGVTASIGFEYTFTHAPFNISLDWKPFFGYPRWSLTSGGLTLRYVFPTTWQ